MQHSRLRSIHDLRVTLHHLERNNIQGAGSCDVSELKRKILERIADLETAVAVESADFSTDAEPSRVRLSSSQGY